MGMQTEPKASITFAYDYELNAKLVKEIAQASPAINKIVHREALCNALVAFLLLGTIMFFLVRFALQQVSMKDASYLLSGIIAVSIALLFMMHRMGHSRYHVYRKAMAKTLAQCEELALASKSMPVMATIELSEFGITYREARGGSQFPWSTFESIYSDSGAVTAIYKNACDGIVIPAGAFPTTQDMENFATLARSLFEAAPDTKLQQAEHLVCANCAYPCEGELGTLCPECGKRKFAVHTNAHKFLRNGWFRQLMQMALSK